MECQEIFLKDIIKVEVISSNPSHFATPSTVPNVRSFSNVTLPTPVVSYAYDGEGTIARENSISIKQTPQQVGSSTIYIYNVDATLEGDYDTISDKLDSLMNTDHNIILTKSDGSRLLLYTLPGSFAVNATDNLKEMSLKLSLSSANNFISIISDIIDTSTT